MRSVGNIAERFVAACLEEQGWQILAKNYQRRSFEIDLIAGGGELLVFVEVKFRKTLPDGWSGSGSLLPRRKCAALARGARHFLTATSQNLTSYNTFRFDLALVSPSGLRGPLLLRYYPAVFSPEIL